MLLSRLHICNKFTSSAFQKIIKSGKRKRIDAGGKWAKKERREGKKTQEVGAIMMAIM